MFLHRQFPCSNALQTPKSDVFLRHMVMLPDCWRHFHRSQTRIVSRVLRHLVAVCSNQPTIKPFYWILINKNRPTIVHFLGSDGWLYAHLCLYKSWLVYRKGWCKKATCELAPLSWNKVTAGVSHILLRRLVTLSIYNVLFAFHRSPLERAPRGTWGTNAGLFVRAMTWH